VISIWQSSLPAIRLPDVWAKIAALVLLAGMAACSGDHVADVPSQKWGDMEVRVESRPSPPHPGMNEFLVTVTDKRGRPGYDLVVSLRTSDQDAWTQAIEDGQVGVYRRAVRVASGARPVLQVQIKRNGTEDILYFPLQMQQP
jgi:hypothetical protein